MAVVKLVLLGIMLIYVVVSILFKHNLQFREKILEELKERINDTKYMSETFPNVFIVNSSVPTLLLILLIIFG